MTTQTRASYCSGCGEAVMARQRYCSGCGQLIAGQGVDEVEDDSGSGVLSKIETALAGIVAVPLALIMVVVSTALPILIVVGLFMGPSDTWNMLRSWVPGAEEAEAAGCEDFEGWMNASNQRANELYTLVDPVQKREVEDPEALRSISSDMWGLVNEQRLSSPPPEADTLNDLLSDLCRLMAQGVAAVANGNYADMQAYDAEYREIAAQADEEDKRVRLACL